MMLMETVTYRSSTIDAHFLSLYPHACARLHASCPPRVTANKHKSCVSGVLLCLYFSRVTESASGEDYSGAVLFSYRSLTLWILLQCVIKNT